MQPDNTDAQQKLAQLPITLVLALLASDQLKVASENSALAAATFWLQHEMLRRDCFEPAAQISLTDVKRQLILKLRLCQCSPSYLMSCLNDAYCERGPESAGFTSMHFWMREQLDANQRGKLIWGANRVAAVRAATGNELGPRSMEELQVPVQIGAGSSWWHVARPASNLTCGKMQLEVTLSELAAQGRVLSKPCWYGGYTWKLRVTWPEDSSSSSSSSIGVCVDCDKGAVGCSIPVACKATVNAAHVHDSERDMVGEIQPWELCGGWTDFFCQQVGSLADASNKLGEFIHADGKLHFTAEVSQVG